MRFAIALLGVLLLAGDSLAQTPAPAAAPPRVLKPGFAALPEPLTPWVAPNRPHWKLSDILAAHAGQARWRLPVVRDNYWNADFIQMAPGEKTKRLMYTDSEMFWVVQSGQLRVSVDGLDPFLAGKSMVVQIPPNTFFQMEVVGDVPALRFQVIRAGMLPVYAEEETPTPLRGYRFVRAAISAAVPKLDPARVYIDFDKDVVGGKVPAGRFLRSGSFIRGKSIPTPPRDDLGHWHTVTCEFYFIMEGTLDYQLEGAEPFIAEQGDVIYVPFGRFHRNNFSGGGMATRLAIFPTGQINQVDPNNPSRQAP